MADKQPYIIWFQDCDKTFLPFVGGKNASLGEMTRAGIRVPPGFAITADWAKRTSERGERKRTFWSLFQSSNPRATLSL